ncbi:hypothetical protein GCK32_006941 [Trichostrongylus colubriformis]|uniref:Uncharacterized protein n=1 Tax=Trichostrongylus colubriformis TaxID=6319 RepID=A0AAN8IKQ6_TRICO
MVKEVKQDVLKRSIIKQPPVSTDIESVAEPVSEEMERKVIEDVIEHMKRSFVRAARGTKTINELVLRVPEHIEMRCLIVLLREGFQD